MKKIQHLIGGEWEGDVGVITKSPVNLTPFATSARGTAAGVAKAVLAASKALPSWSGWSPAERGEALSTLVARLRDAYGEEGEKTALKATIMEEVGKPLPEADLEVMECAQFTEFFCNVAPEYLSPQAIEIDPALWPTKRSVVDRLPHGVVAIIKPWNYPIEMIVWALSPALLAGNTVVIKPSEKAPASAGHLAELIKGSKIPPGVVNVVFGDANTGRALVSHPDVRMVSFTGSVEAGRDVASACARQLKKVSLELGGNDAAVVLPDVDLEFAANGLVWGAFCNAGQVCVGIKRAYVVGDIFDELAEIIVEKTKALRQGVDYGPLIDEIQFNLFNEFVQDAIQKGNRLLAGGQRGNAGYYYSPTVLEINNDRTKLLSAECFGPALPLVRVEELEQALERANASEYGLGASIWAGDVAAGEVVAKMLKTGMVWVNDVNVAFPETPWGGTKQSGIGFELSREALAEYSYARHINVDTSDEKKRFWWYPY